MMVTGLQSPLQSFPLDGMSAKSPSIDSGTNQPLSFGEILKAKEKQFQQEQEVSASSVAAALAALQTLPIAMPSVPDIETKDDMQLGGQTSASGLKPLQSSTPDSLDVLPELAAKMIGTINQPDATQAVTERSLSTESPVSVSEPSQSIQAKLSDAVIGESVAFDNTLSMAMKLSTSETMLHKNTMDQTISTVEKTAIKTESTSVRPNNITSNVASPTVTTPLETPTAETKKIELQTLTVNSVLSPEETRDAKPEQVTTSPSMEASNAPTGESNLTVTETDIENAVEKPASPPIPRTEVSEETQTQSSPVQVEADQVSTVFATAQAESRVGASGPELKMSGKAATQGSIAQTITNKEANTSVSRQDGKNPANVLDAKVETPEASTVHYSSAQSVREQPPGQFVSQQVENPTPAAPPQSQSQDETSVPDSIAQSTIRQGTTSFDSQQTEKPIETKILTVEVSEERVGQLSSNQPGATQETIPFTPERPENSTSTNASRFASSSTQASTSQTEAEQAATPIAAESAETLVDMPVFQTAHVVSDPFVVDGETLTPTSRQETVSSNIATTDTKDSPMDVEVPVSPQTSPSREIETETVGAQTALNTTATAFPEFQSTNDPLTAQTEINPEAKTTEMKTDMPVETALFAQSKTETGQNAETNQIEPVQLQRREMNDVGTDLGFNDKIEGTIPEIAVQTKSSTANSLQPQIKPTLPQAETDYANIPVEKSTVEIKPDVTIRPSSTSASSNDVVEDIRPYQVQIPVQIPSSEVPASPADITTHDINKITQQSDLNLGMVDSSLTQSAPKIRISNSAMISEEAVEFSPSLQNAKAETESLTGNTTNSRAGVKQFVSQVASNIKASESLQAQDMPETQPAANTIISEEILDNVKQVEQRKDQTTGSVAPSIANTARIDSTVEEPVTVSSEQSELFNTDPVGFTPDTLIGDVTTSEKVIPQMSTDNSSDVAQSMIDLSDILKDFPATEPNDYLKENTLSETTLSFGENVGEDVVLQHDETLPLRPSTPQTNGVVTNIKLTDNSEIVEAQATLSNAKEMIDVDQPATHVGGASINIEPQDLSVGSNKVKLQTNTTISLVDGSQSAVSFSATEKDELTVNTNTHSVEVQPRTSMNMEEPVISSDQPAIDATQTQIDKNQKQLVEPRINLSQADTAASPTEISRSKIEVSADTEHLPDSQTGNETPEVEVLTPVEHEKIAITPDETEPDRMPTKTVIRPEEAAFETRGVASQEVTGRVSEAEKLASRANLVLEPGTGNKLNEEIHQSNTQQLAEQALPLQSAEAVLIAVADINQKEFISEAQLEKSSVNTSDVIESVVSSFALQTDETVANQTDARPEHLSTQSVPTTMETSKESASDAQSIRLTRETPESKNVESQVHSESTGTELPQGITKTVEKDETGADADVAKKSKEPISVETNETVMNSHTTFRSESKTATDQVPLTSVSNSETSSSFQPGASIKAEIGKQSLRTKPAVSKDEETFSSEKQPKLSQISESPAVSTSPIKETMTVEVNGKVPAGQINSQAAEVAQQVIHQMNVRIKNGPTSMHLQLSPKDLGNIDVEMVSTSQGIHVTFFAEQANTGKLLETQLNQLRESLIDSGVQLSGLNISQHGPSEQKGGFSHNTSFAQGSSPDFIQNETNDTEVPNSERTTGHLGEVDYRI